MSAMEPLAGLLGKHRHQQKRQCPGSLAPGHFHQQADAQPADAPAVGDPVSSGADRVAEEASDLHLLASAALYVLIGDQLQGASSGHEAADQQREQQPGERQRAPVSPVEEAVILAEVRGPFQANRAQCPSNGAPPRGQNGSSDQYLQVDEGRSGHRRQKDSKQW